MSTTLAEKLAKKLKLTDDVGLEDNSQVEVNFHIDTENDDVTDTSNEVVDTDPIAVPTEGESGVDAEEATADTAQAADEVEQLDEAQNSLENLKLVLDKHIENDTMSRMGLKSYQLALESILPSHVLSEVDFASFESTVNESKYQAAIMARDQLTDIQSKLNSISMEARGDWLKKTKHKIAVFFKREKALEKRARALYSLAETSENEHASNKTITVNGDRKTLKLENITTLKWSREGEFKDHVDHFCDLYNSMANVKPGYDDEFTDHIFPDSRKWKKNIDGNPEYKTFRIKLVRKDNLVIGHSFPKSDETVSLPNLTPAMCKNVLQTVINTLVKGKIMNDNINVMLDVLEKVMVLDESIGVGPRGRLTTKYTEKYPDGYLEMYDTLQEMKSLRIKVTNDILNYVNYSLTDREFV